MCAKCLQEVEKNYTIEEYVEFETAIMSGTATREDTDKFAQIMAKCAV